MGDRHAEFAGTIWKPGTARPDPFLGIGRETSNGRTAEPFSRSITPESYAELRFFERRQRVAATSTAEPGTRQRPPSRQAPSSSDTARRSAPILRTTATAGQNPPGPSKAFITRQSQRLRDKIAHANPKKGPLTPAEEARLKQENPDAFSRYSGLSKSERKDVLIDHTEGGTIIFIPGRGWSSSRGEIDRLWPDIPPGIKEIFVAGPGDSGILGIREIEGNWYLFGGLIDLGSPGMPGAGTAAVWWVPDRILWADMSPYFNYHDKHYYGDDVLLSDIGAILSHEWNSFLQGVSLDPLRMTLQIVYSAATTTFGVLTATYNSATGMLGEFSRGFLSCIGLGRAGESAAGMVGGEGTASPSALVSALAGEAEETPVAPGVSSGAAGTGTAEEGLVVSGRSGGAAARKELRKRPLTDEERAKVEKGIEEIKRSEFGRTDEGRKVVAALEEKLGTGPGDCQIMWVEEGAVGDAHYSMGDGKIYLEDTAFSNETTCAAMLVHEGSHVVDDADFPGSRYAVEHEIRAYENQARFLEQYRPDDPLVRAYRESATRREFGEWIRSRRSGLYADRRVVGDGRYPPAKPDWPKERPDRGRYPGDGLGDREHELDMMNYESRRRGEEALRFEREREEEFQRFRRTQSTRPRRTPTPTPRPGVQPEDGLETF